MDEQGHGSTAEGFTLIELLVVMVIIGVLAAIAIPSFLAQRSKGYEAGIKSDLKSAAVAEHAYASDHDGAFVADTFRGPNPATGVATDISSATADPLAAQGMRATSGDTIEASLTTNGTESGFCLVGTSSHTGASWYLSSKDDVPHAGTACS